MNDLLGIGASGLATARAALAATSENVANANTVGYARRTVRIGEIDAGTSGPLYRDRTRFYGSQATGTLRSVDAFRTADARLAASDAASATTLSTWLDRGEVALGTDITGSVATFFAAGERLAADPTSTAARHIFLDGLDGAAHAIARAGGDLAQVAQNIADNRASVTASTSAQVDELARVDALIARLPGETSTAATLGDQRDRLRDAIAEANGTLTGLTAAASQLADRRAALDSLAATFVTAVNGWHAAGSPQGAPLLAMAAGGASLVALPVAARDLSPADSDAANGNALALAQVRADSGVEARAAALVAAHASRTAAARTAARQSGERRDAAASARDAVEGVDLDREAADLLRYQQAYQGAAKVVQTARDTLDAILALFR